MFFFTHNPRKEVIFQGLVLRTWMHVLVWTEEGATTAHFITPPQGTMYVEKCLTHLTQSLLHQRVFFISYNENNIVFCFNHSLMCIFALIIHNCVLLVVEKCVFVVQNLWKVISNWSLGATSLDARFGWNWGGGNNLHILTPPPTPPPRQKTPKKHTMEMEKYLTRSCFQQILFFLCYITKIKSCFTLIIHYYVLLGVKKVFLLSRIHKKGDFHAWVRWAWMQLLVGIE